MTFHDRLVSKANNLTIQVCQSVEDAPNYNTNGEGIKPAILERAVIVKNGTERGNDTVDLVFSDKNGNLYIAMITATLLKSVTDLTKTITN